VDEAIILFFQEDHVVFGYDLVLVSLQSYCLILFCWRKSPHAQVFAVVLLGLGSRRQEREKAIKAYEDGKVSFGKASEIAGLNLWDWIDEMHRRDVHWQFSVTDAQQELETRRNRK